MLQHFNRFLHWSTTATLYSICFFIRVSPNTLQAVLQSDLGLSFGQLGIVSAAFYYSYAIAQCLGSLAAHYIGLYHALCWCLFSLVSGLILFIFSKSFALLVLSRLLMGMGASLMFFYTLSLSEKMFPHSRFSLFVGLTNMLGIFGALMSQTPLESLLETLHWRYIFAILLCAVVLIIFPILYQESYFEAPSSLEHGDQALRNEVKLLAKNHHSFFKACFFSCAMMLPMIVIPEMWGSLFLEEIYLLNSLEASVILSFFFFGVALGSFSQIIFALDSLVLRHFEKVLLAEIISVSCFLFWPWLTPFLLKCLALIVGFCASLMLIFFSLLRRKYPNHLLIIPFFNMILMLTVSGFQPLLGYIFDGLKVHLGLKISLLAGMSLSPLMLVIAYGFYRFGQYRSYKDTPHDYFLA